LARPIFAARACVPGRRPGGRVEGGARRQSARIAVAMSRHCTIPSHEIVIAERKARAAHTMLWARAPLAAIRARPVNGPGDETADLLSAAQAAGRGGLRFRAKEAACEASASRSARFNGLCPCSPPPNRSLIATDRWFISLERYLPLNHPWVVANRHFMSPELSIESRT